MSILPAIPVAPACSLIHCLCSQGSASGSFILYVVLHYVDMTMPREREYISFIGDIVHFDIVGMFVTLTLLTLKF